MSFKTLSIDTKSNLPTHMLRHVLCPDSKNVGDTTIKLREMTSAMVP